MTNLAPGWRHVFLFILFSAITTICFPQRITLNAAFASDTTRIGDNIYFYLTARYPKTQQVVFPDSSFSFSPFELLKKDYFPTRSNDSTSYDSAVYSLRTFEIEKQQSLRLPVFII